MADNIIRGRKDGYGGGVGMPGGLRRNQNTEPCPDSPSDSSTGRGQGEGKGQGKNRK